MRLILIISIIFVSFNIFAQEINEEEIFLLAKNAYDEEGYNLSLDLFNRFIKDFPKSQRITEAQIYIAQCLFQNDKFIEARDILTKLEKVYVPYEIQDRLLFWLGQAYLKVKDFNLAREYFKKIIETFPDSNLLVSAKMQVGEILLQENNFKEAESIFDSLTKSKDPIIQEEALFKKGETLFFMKDYNRTIDTYGLFIKIFWDSNKLAKANFYIGESNFYLDNFKESIEYYSKAFGKTDEDLIKIESELGMGWSYLKQNQLKEAEEAFLNLDKFKDIEFNKESLYLGCAILYSQLNKLQPAITYYDKLLNLNISNDLRIQALFGKAECLDRLSHFQEAIDVYKEVINIEPQDDNKEIIDRSNFNLGIVYLKLGDFKSALPLFQNLVNSTSGQETKLSALYHLAEIYSDTQEFDKAIETYSVILKDYPNNSFSDYINYQIALTQLKSDDNNLAIISFKDFNKNFTESDLLDDVNYYLGYAFFKNNELQNSCQQFQKFLEAFPDSVYKDRTIYLLAISFYNRGEFKEAVKNFEIILKEFKNNKDLVEKSKYQIASSLYQMGEENLAIKEFQQFIDDYPKSEITPNIIFWLGQYYYQNSQYELARRNFEMIIRMYPEYNLAQEAKYEIGISFLAEGKFENALKTFRRLLDESDMGEIKLKTMLSLADLLLQENKQEEAIQMYKDLIRLASLNTDVNNSVSSSENNQDKTKLEKREFLDYTDNIAKTDSLSKLTNITDREEKNKNFINEIIKQAYTKLGYIYKDNKNLTEAIYAYKEAMNSVYGESVAEFQFKIAECLEEKHDLNAAIEEYLKIPSVYEKDKFWVVKGLLRCARIYENKEDWQNAIKTYEDVLNYDVEEVKFAKEKIEFIRQHIKFN